MPQRPSLALGYIVTYVDYAHVSSTTTPLTAGGQDRGWPHLVLSEWHPIVPLLRRPPQLKALPRDRPHAAWGSSLDVPRVGGLFSVRAMLARHKARAG